MVFRSERILSSHPSEPDINLTASAVASRHALHAVTVRQEPAAGGHRRRALLQGRKSLLESQLRRVELALQAGQAGLRTRCKEWSLRSWHTCASHGRQGATYLQPVQTCLQPVHLLLQIFPGRHVHLLQQPFLSQDVSPPLLQLGPGVRELLESFHQVLFGEAEEVRVAQTADVGGASVAHLAATYVEDADFSEATSGSQDSELGNSVVPNHSELAVFDDVHLLANISLWEGEKGDQSNRSNQVMHNLDSGLARLAK